MEQEQEKELTFVYIIDEEFRMVYSNDDLKQKLPEFAYGQHCYEVICNEQKQCEQCPLREENRGKGIIFDKLHGEWIRVRKAPIEWPGAGSCSVIITEKASDGGLYRERYFFRNAEEFLQKRTDDTRWCMVSLDIDKLKLFNEWMGVEAGDKLLEDISGFLKRQQEKQDMIAGYCGSDNFAVVMEYDEKKIEQLYQDIAALMDAYSSKKNFLPAFGIYEILDKNEPAFIMYDRAELARTAAKDDYNVKINKFDAQMLEKLKSRYALYADVNKAFQENEFIFYLQPKCNMENGRLIGAEALVRWMSKEKGMISPGVFIPFLEDTGLIVDLDMYIWEEVCRWQRSMIDRGLQTVPVSVNVSKLDIFSMDVAAYFQELIRKYDLSVGLIEIEITESVYAKNSKVIHQTVDQLRKAGFKILMDDFGSGFSSLNILKDISVDVVKIDMRFLDVNENNINKGYGILKTVYDMACTLGIHTIVEGVETEEQKTLLLKIGYGYGQGFYFYRPLPVSEFEVLTGDDNNLDIENPHEKKFEPFYLKDFLMQDLLNEIMMNNMLGAVAFFEVHEGQIMVTQCNEQYDSLYGDVSFDIDKGHMFSLFESARKQQNDGAEGEVRGIRLDGSYVWIHLRAIFLMEQDGYEIYYCSARNDTELHEGAGAPADK